MARLVSTFWRQSHWPERTMTTTNPLTSLYITTLFLVTETLPSTMDPNSASVPQVLKEEASYQWCQFCTVHDVLPCINIVLQVCTSTLMTAVMASDFRSTPRTASTVRPVISSVPVRTLTGWRHREARGRLTMACECWTCLSSHWTCNEESERQTEVRCHYRNCFSWLLHNQCKNYLV